jgi:hypothetical protein
MSDRFTQMTEKFLSQGLLFIIIHLTTLSSTDFMASNDGIISA